MQPPSGHSLVIPIAVDNSLLDVSPLASPSGARVVREDANLTHSASASSQPNVARIAPVSLTQELDARETALADHRRRRSRGPLIDAEQVAVIRRLESFGIGPRHPQWDLLIRSSRVREAFFNDQNDGVQRIDSQRVRSRGRGRGRRGGQHRS